MTAKAGIVVAGMVFAASALEQIAGALGLLAGIVVSLGIIAAGGRALWRFFRRLEIVVENTSLLPEFIHGQKQTNDEVNERLDRGAERMERIEATIGTWASAERAAVSAVIETKSAPRPPRRTDPPPRTGWRE